MRYEAQQVRQSQCHVGRRGKPGYQEVREGDVRLQNILGLKYLQDLCHRKLARLIERYEQFHQHLEYLDRLAKHQHQQSA